MSDYAIMLVSSSELHCVVTVSRDTAENQCMPGHGSCTRCAMFQLCTRGEQH